MTGKLIDEFASAEEALVVNHHVVETIIDDDLERPTPCPSWNVQSLADHLVDTIARLGAAVGISTTASDGGSIDRQIQQVTQPILAEWARRGLADDVVFSGRTLPAHLALGILCLELIVHGWDFAVALGSSFEVSDTLAADVLTLAQQTLNAESRAAAGFDPPVPVPVDASPLDQLVAFTGREPRRLGWATTSANTTSRVIEIDGARLYAEIRSGTTPALVFLHYWGGSRRTWRPVLTHLHPDQAYVNYDQRGWGDSASAPGPYDIDRLTDDAQSVAATLGTEYVLVGHSMGGKVAQALTARSPAGLAGVVLVAPAPAAPAGSTERLQQLTMHAYDDEQTVADNLDLVLTYQPLPADCRTQIIEDSLRAGEEARLAWPKYGLAQDVSAGLANVDTPVLVLAGSHDRVEAPAMLADHLLPLLKHARMTVLRDTGHLSPLEVPDAVAEQITSFINQLNDIPSQTGP